MVDIVRFTFSGLIVRVSLLLVFMLLLASAIQMVAASAAQAVTLDRVSRVGSQLVLNGSTWRFAGVNMYWLGRDDNVTDFQGPSYPSHAKIDDGFDSAHRLGATVVRSISMGVSVGSSRSLEPTLGHFNDAAFDTIDYSIAVAARDNIHLMIPLTDMWHYYGGGKHTFTSWRGYADLPGQTAVTSVQQKVTEQRFYTDPAVVSDFHTYIAHVLNHVNPYTGLRLADDPTIAIWETGNELWDAPPSWTANTATFIKSLAPLALVADGSAATGKHVADAAVGAPDVDILGGHFYPKDAVWAATDAAVAARHGKAYIVGEFALGSDTAGWLAGLAANPNVTGAMPWVLMPHLPDGTPESSGDGFAFHVPGATAEEAAQVAAFAAAAPLFGSGGTPAAIATGPVNLVGSAVASASPPATFVGNSSGAGGVTISNGQSIGGATSIRATANSAGYAWVYPGAGTSGARVVPGHTYTATVTAHPVAGAVATPFAAHLTWYDANGSYLGGSDGRSVTPVGGTSTTLTATASAPISAAWAVPQWQSGAPLATGDAVDLASFGIADGTVAPVAPTPTPTSVPSGPQNLMSSTGVVSATTASLFSSGGSGSTAPALAVGLASGVSILRVTAATQGYAWVYPRSPSSGAPVTPGLTYTASLAVRGATLTTTSLAGAAHLTWYDSAGNWLGGSDGASALVSADWRTVSVTAAVPSRAAWAVPQWQSATVLSVGDKVDLTPFGIAQGGTGPAVSVSRQGANAHGGSSIV